MSPRTGRPTSNPKGDFIALRLDKECSDILETFCKEKQVNKSDAVRVGIKKLKDDITKK